MRRKLTFLVVWLLGLALIYLLTQPGPRRGWQPPPNHQHVGVLADDRTLVTVMRPPSAMSAQCTGPIRLWDVATGEMLREHFDATDVFANVHVGWGDHLVLRLEGGETEHQIVDARTKELRWSFRWEKGWTSHLFMGGDGSTALEYSVSKAGSTLRLRDVATGRLQHAIKNQSFPFVLSPNGRLLVTMDDVPRKDEATAEGVRRIRLWDRAEDVLREIPLSADNSNEYSSAMFSTDGSLLLLDRARVIDTLTGKLNFAVPAVAQYACSFTKDSRWLVVVHQVANAPYVAWYDVATGLEDEARRTSLPARHVSQILSMPRYGQRHVISQGHASNPAGRMPGWLPRIPALQLLMGPPIQNQYVIVDVDSARVVGQGEGGMLQDLAMDGTIAIVRDSEGRTVLYDVPERKPVGKLVMLMAAWSALLGFGAWALRRRRQS